MTQPNPQPVAKSDQTIWIYLSYILGWLFGLIGLAIVKDDDRVRFHCAQALVFSVALYIVYFVLMILNVITAITIVIPILIMLLMFVVGIGALVYIIMLLVKVSKGENPRIPYCGDFADKHLMKLFK